MKGSSIRNYSVVFVISIFYGLMAIPIDIILALKMNSIKLVHMLLLSFRSGIMTMILVCIFTSLIYILLRALNHKKPDVLKLPIQQALLIGAGMLIIVIFLELDRYYNNFQGFFIGQVFGGIAAVFVTVISFYILNTRGRAERLAARSRKVGFFGILIILGMLGMSFIPLQWNKAESKPSEEAVKQDIPNILLIVWDAVRADHLSLYGYPLKTTPFLEKVAQDSTVFDQAFAVSPWTLPSHASLFTGFYPSQHNTHGEHFWLDDSFKTIAEILQEQGFQTVNFSNNEYISSYHNLVQGFERTWLKGQWEDNVIVLPGGIAHSIMTFSNEIWKIIQDRLLSKVVRNPISLLDSPSAAVTNKSIFKWLEDERDETKPFFIFINYMDAHLPYNPSDQSARLFLEDEEIKSSYTQKLRFPPIEHCLDASKGKYTKEEIETLKALYDSCIRYLDGELESLFKRLKDLGILEETLIIITSDHGEYLGERNRFAHGFGLHRELLHIPLIIRFPSLFDPGNRMDGLVTHLDVPETLFSLLNIERPMGLPKARSLYSESEDPHPFLFSEFRFPLHLLSSVSLLEDNSKYFVEQKAIFNEIYTLIWKSRGLPEFYNTLNDPSHVSNVYSEYKKEEESMSHELVNFFNSLYFPPIQPDEINVKGKEILELKEKLRALGYIK